jgi:ectoine hydrolase
MTIFDKLFAPEEYAGRVRAVQARMRAAGFDVILCQDPANMCWLTGFDGWSFYVPQCVVLQVDAANPLWFGRAQDAKSARLTTYLPDADIVAFSERLVQHPQEHPYDELAALIRDRGWGRARIGVEMDAHYYTARCHQHLVAGLDGANLANNRDLVNWARLVKSPAEVALMREAGRICTAAIDRATGAMRPGVPQQDVIAAVLDTLTRGVPGAGGDYAAIVPLMPVGEGTSTPHLTWTDRPLPDNTLAMLEISGVRRRYHAPLTRTFHIGTPPPAISDLAKIIVEGVDAALEMARPGNTAEAVEAAWQAVLNKHGLSKQSRVGYSIGLAYPPDWGERTVSLRPGDRTELKEGMCFHIQSGLWLTDHGAAISESCVIGPAGGERLCDAPRELIVVR